MQTFLQCLSWNLLLELALMYGPRSIVEIMDYRRIVVIEPIPPLIHPRICFLVLLGVDRIEI